MARSQALALPNSEVTLRGLKSTEACADLLGSDMSVAVPDDSQKTRPWAMLETRDGHRLGCCGSKVSYGPSAILRLVSAIHIQEIGQAHATLRNRIYSSEKKNLADQNTIKVCASKARYESPDSQARRVIWLDDVADRAEESACFGGRLVMSKRVFASRRDILNDLLEQVKHFKDRRPPMYVQNRGVACALMDPAGRVVLAARNTNGLDRSRHAEINLLALAQRANLLPLKPGYTVLTTLSPCRMCAAWLCRVCLDPTTLRVFAHARDPGRLGQETELDRLGRLEMVD